MFRRTYSNTSLEWILNSTVSYFAPSSLFNSACSHCCWHYLSHSFTFTAFDSRTRSVRELLRQVQAERFSKANPKLKIKANVLGTVDPPIAEFEFVDGTVVRSDLIVFAHLFWFLAEITKGKHLSSFRIVGLEISRPHSGRGYAGIEVRSRSSIASFWI